MPDLQSPRFHVNPLSGHPGCFVPVQAASMRRAMLMAFLAAKAQAMAFSFVRPGSS